MLRKKQNNKPIVFIKTLHTFGRKSFTNSLPLYLSLEVLTVFVSSLFFDPYDTHLEEVINCAQRYVCTTAAFGGVKTDTLTHAHAELRFTVYIRCLGLLPARSSWEEKRVKKKRMRENEIIGQCSYVIGI